MISASGTVSSGAKSESLGLRRNRRNMAFVSDPFFLRPWSRRDATIAAVVSRDGGVLLTRDATGAMEVWSPTTGFRLCTLSPRLLILDEPTANLDEETKEEVLAAVDCVQRECARALRAIPCRETERQLQDEFVYSAQ